MKLTSLQMTAFSTGAGKSTLMKKLTDEFVNDFGFSVSHTTRQPRPGEEDGIHYYFVTREEMQRAITNGEFIEHAEYSGMSQSVHWQKLELPYQKSLEEKKVVDRNRLVAGLLHASCLTLLVWTCMQSHYHLTMLPFRHQKHFLLRIDSSSSSG